MNFFSKSLFLDVDLQDQKMDSLKKKFHIANPNFFSPQEVHFFNYWICKTQKIGLSSLSV